ncbi:MAG: YfhO family protein [Clostridiales bacterium]|nr:YfhO family protein [Clostridiales bacterium]
MDNDNRDFESVELSQNGENRVLSRVSSFFKGLVGSQYFHLLGAFFLPVLLMMGAHAAVSFYPFGNQSILTLDFQAQYIYYFENIRRLITEGGSWLYTWSRTLGGEFMGYVAYYMGSPFNFIVALFPVGSIAMAVSVVVLSKIGAMGLTMGIYLHKTRGTRDLRTLMFSSMYALCGYVTVQQYNPMWLDALVWLPMLVLGIERLVKDRKIILYIISLSLILCANYYIGYMCCIFTLLYFVYYYLLVRPEMLPEYESEKRGISKFFSLCGTRAFIRIAFATAVTFLISAFMLLCAYYSLSFGKVGFSNPSFKFAFRFDFLDIAVKMLVGSYDTVRDNGLPVIYSGILSMMLLPVFYMSKQISPRKKILTTALLGSLLLSFVLNPVDLAWHGFSAPNWLNYRYSFLFSFVVIVMACDALKSFESVKFGHFAASGVALIVIICIIQKFNYSFTQGTRSVALDDILSIGISLMLAVAYLCILYGVRVAKNESVAALVLAVAVCVELIGNSIITIADVQMDVGTVKYDNYDSGVNTELYDSYNGSVERLRVIFDDISENDKSFYRTESTIYRQRGGVNEQMSAGFYGISASTSTLNKDVIRLMAKFGYASVSHWTKYLGGTPVGDALFGIKYVISTDRPTEANGGTITQNNKHSFDSNFYVKAYEEEEPEHLYPSDYKIFAMQNTKALPIAYGVSRDVRLIENVYSMETYYTAMDMQNQLINAMLSEKMPDANVMKPLKMTYTYADATVNKTPLTYNWDGGLITSNSYVITKTGTAPSITFSTTAVSDGIVYFHFPTVNFGKTAKVYVNNKFLTNYFADEDTCAMELGTFKTGDSIKVKIALDNDVLYIDAASDSYFWYVDYSAMNEAFDYLSEAALYIDDFGNDRIHGYMSVGAGQELVFTTIPYDAGWNVYVDGEKVGTEKVLDALLAFEVAPGEHEITMKYFPGIYKIGLAGSALGFAILAVIIVYYSCDKFRTLVKSLVTKKEKKTEEISEDKEEISETPEQTAEE